MAVSVTFNRTVREGTVTYTVAGSPYSLPDQKAYKYIARGWASGTVSGSRQVDMNTQYKHGTQNYLSSNLYTIDEPLASLLIDEGMGAEGASGAETLLGYITVTNGTASTQTNQLVKQGFPIPYGALTDGRHINIYDGPTSASPRIANFQGNNRSTLDGSARFERLIFTVPTIAANATRVCSVYVSDTLAPTGTPVTTADILALGMFSGQGLVMEMTIGGVTQSWNLKDVLTNAVTTFSKTGACRHVDQGGIGWSTGVASYCEYFSDAFRNGGTAHLAGDGLRGEVELFAYKANPGPVSVSNPILGVGGYVVIKNGSRAGWSELAIQSGRIRRSTSLTDGTLIQSAVTDLDGNTITYDFTSGWTHWGGGSYSVDFWIGQRPSCISALGDCTTTANGTAKTPTGAQMYDYLKSCDVTLAVADTFASIDHSSFITQMNTTSKTKPLQFGSGFRGNISLNEPGGGDRPDLRVIPDWYTRSQLRHDANGRRLLYENSNVSCGIRITTLGLKYTSATERFYKQGDTYPASPSQTAGDPHNLDSAHEAEKGFSAYLLTGDYRYYECLNARVAAVGNGNVYNGTGQNFTQFGDYSKGGQLIDGNGYTNGNLQSLTDVSSGQMRASAWVFRTQCHFGFVCADRFTASNLLSWDQTWARENVRRPSVRMANVIAANTGPSSTWNRFANVGIRYTHTGTNDGYPIPQVSGYMKHYLALAVGHAVLLKFGYSELDTFANWVAQEYIGAYTASGVWRDALFDAYWEEIFFNTPLSDETRIRTHTELYLKISQHPGNITGVSYVNSSGDRSRWRPVEAIATLNQTSGNIIVTIPGLSTMIAPENVSWYIGKWFCVNPYLPSRPAGGRGQITGFNLASDQVLITTSVTLGVPFGGTSYNPNDTWTLPFPAPGDNPGDGTRHLSNTGEDGGASSQYIDLARSATAILARAGVPDVLQVYTYLRAWSPTADEGDTSNNLVP
jgi:hypothetical protein